MIGFFRRIRKKLADDNQFLKYSRYAIGEILLVVVGILIALQVNNWNQKRLQKKEDVNFLISLQSELILDTTQLGNRIRGYIDRNERIKATLALMDSSKTISYSQYNGIIGTFQSMEVLTPIGKNLHKNDVQLANGSLTRISSGLHEDYTAYLQRTSSDNAIISKLGETLQELATLYVAPSLDLTRDSLIFAYGEFDRIKKNRFLKNTLVKSIGYRSIHINYMRNQRESATVLLDSIGKQLAAN